MGKTLKPATTCEEQVQLLINRGITVCDEKRACTVLGHLNYYRLSAYMLPYKSKNGEYQNINFEKILAIYTFDQALRSCIFSFVEQIEITIRTRIAYFHGHSYGPEGYLNVKNFVNPELHKRMIDSFNREKDTCKNLLFVKHHDAHYGGKMPVWAAVEILSLTAISNFYANMPTQDQKTVAQKYGIGSEYLRSWLICICELRNRCAHYMRLYYYNFLSTPKIVKNDSALDPNNYKLFNILYVGRYLIGGRDEFWDPLKIRLKNIVDEFSEHIDIHHIGFADNWFNLIK